MHWSTRKCHVTTRPVTRHNGTTMVLVPRVAVTMSVLDGLCIYEFGGWRLPRQRLHNRRVGDPSLVSVASRLLLSKTVVANKSACAPWMLLRFLEDLERQLGECSEISPCRARDLEQRFLLFYVVQVCCKNWVINFVVSTLVGDHAREPTIP